MKTVLISNWNQDCDYCGGWLPWLAMAFAAGRKLFCSKQCSHYGRAR